MKKLLLMIVAVCLISTISAFMSGVPSGIYLDVNTTYPLILIPLDENVYNVSLNILDDGNITTLNFTWTGEQYELNILFNEVGNYPFVINSTDVTGELTGTFLVREGYEVTIRLFQDKRSYPFFSNKYINEMSYVTAELVGERTLFSNNYDTSLEPFVAPLRDDRFLKSVWYGRYNNGVATIKLYEEGDYALRLIDGEITFNGEYSVPNITDSYGINSYLGTFNIDNETENISLLVEQKDLHPYRWLFNWLLVIGVILVCLTSVIMFFAIPEHTQISVLFGIGFTFMLVVARIVLFIFVE